MRRIVATAAALALAAGTVAACASDADDAAKALRAYAAAWQDGKLDTVAYAGSGTNDVLAQYRQITAALVGLEPQKTQPPAEVVGKIATALKKVGITLDTADVLKRLGAAKPDAFVPVITLRRPQYDLIRPDIHDLPGLVRYAIRAGLISSER